MEAGDARQRRIFTKAANFERQPWEYWPSSSVANNGSDIDHRRRTASKRDVSTQIAGTGPRATGGDSWGGLPRPSARPRRPTSSVSLGNIGHLRRRAVAWRQGVGSLPRATGGDSWGGLPRPSARPRRPTSSVSLGNIGHLRRAVAWRQGVGGLPKPPAGPRRPTSSVSLGEAGHLRACAAMAATSITDENVEGGDCR